MPICDICEKPIVDGTQVFVEGKLEIVNRSNNHSAGVFGETGDPVVMHAQCLVSRILRVGEIGLVMAEVTDSPAHALPPLHPVLDDIHW